MPASQGTEGSLRVPEAAPDGNSVDLPLLDMPPSILVAVLSHLPDVCDLVRACTACRPLYALLHTNAWRGISTLQLPAFDPSFKAAAPWIRTSFPDLSKVDVSGCSALPEAWLGQLASGRASITHLNVDDIWGWQGQESLPALAPGLQSLSACNTSLPLCSRQCGWLQGAGLVHLTSLKLAGLVKSPQRCRTHGSSECRCQDATLLGALLSANPKLRELDLSANPKLPTRMLEAALAGQPNTTSSAPTYNTTALTHVSLRGCVLLQPPVALLLYNQQLQDLDLAGTATADADITVLLSCLPRLRRLDLSGCTQVSDAGLRELQSAAAVTNGTLLDLGLGGLPRVSPGPLAALLKCWVTAVWAARELQLCEQPCEEDSDHQRKQQCGQQERQQGGQQQQQQGWRQGQHGVSQARTQLLRLHLAHSGAVTDEVARALAAAVLELPRHAGAENAAAGPVVLSAAAAASWAEVTHPGAGADVSSRACHHGSLNDTAHMDALTSSMLKLQLAPPCTTGTQLHADRPNGSGTIQQPNFLPPVSFEALNLAGCSKLSGDALAELAASGCFAHLRSLDLSHFEGLRLAKAIGPAAAAGGCEGGSSREPSTHHPTTSSTNGTAGASSLPVLPLPALFCTTTPMGCGSHLQHLRLDGCHLTNEAAVLIAAACPRLGTLSLVGCRGLGDAGIKAFVANCGASLRNLCIGGASSAWREDVALQGLTALTSLRVSRRSHLLDAHLAPVLAANAGLRSLTLAGCYSITDAALAAAPASLESLRLVACDGVTGEGLQRLRRLRQLALGGCVRVRQEAVQAVAVCCKRLVLLELPAHIGQQCLPHQGHGAGHLQGLRVVEHSTALYTF